MMEVPTILLISSVGTSRKYLTSLDTCVLPSRHNHMCTHGSVLSDFWSPDPPLTLLDQLEEGFSSFLFEG